MLALTLSVAATAPAEGSTLTRNPILTFTAAPGVANVVTLSRVGSTLTIETPDDPVEALPAFCSDPDGTAPATVVQCASAAQFTGNFGDLDDIVTLTSNESNNFMDLRGEAGDDKLTGSRGFQRLQGGAGEDVLSGGADYDEVYGSDGDDTLTDGDDGGFVQGQGGDDTISGEAGADTIIGGSGTDTISGGAGNDELDGEDGVDTVRGDDGDDAVVGGHEGDEPDTIEGGAGNDYLQASVISTVDGGAGSDLLGLVAHYGPNDEVMPMTIDLVAGTASSSVGKGAVKLVEDASVGRPVGLGFTQADGGGAHTLLGTAETNGLFGGDGPDTIDPREGTDFVNAGGGDDKIETVDGSSDRVLCADGVDTATVDAYDTHEGCENVTVRDVRSVYEDAAPKVAITSPASSAVLSTSAPNTITADASDDKGIKHVVFSTGERVLCTDATAPYSCAYVPTSADVGRDTLVAVAVDTSDQTASAVRTVSVPRFTPTGLTAATTPKRDGKAPFEFTTRGRLELPPGVTPAAGCKGTVAVSFKAGRKTISTRRVELGSNCTYSSKVTFRLPRRLSPRTLSVVAVFAGNDVLLPKTAARHTVRPR
jgi:Ca2+-binding RTX toxin-like protein